MSFSRETSSACVTIWARRIHDWSTKQALESLAKPRWTWSPHHFPPHSGFLQQCGSEHRSKSPKQFPHSHATFLLLLLLSLLLLRLHNACCDMMLFAGTVWRVFVMGYKVQHKKSLQVNGPLRTVSSGRCQGSGGEIKQAPLQASKKGQFLFLHSSAWLWSWTDSSCSAFISKPGASSSRPTLMHRVRPGWRRQWALSVCQHRLTFFFVVPWGVDLLHLDRLLAYSVFFFFCSSPALLSLTLTRSDWVRADARCKNPRLRQIFDEVIFARLEDGSQCWHLCTFCTVCLSRVCLSFPLRSLPAYLSPPLQF